MWRGETDGRSEEARRLATLERLLALEATDLKATLGQASDLLAEVLGTDKIDVMLHDSGDERLVALGTSNTPRGHRQHELGLDQLPLPNGGRTVEVFQTGRPYLTGHAERDPGELRGIIEGLGVRSTAAVPFAISGERCGVLLGASAEPERFSERDLRFLEAVARWLGLVAQRAELVERLAARAAEEGVRRGTEAAISALTARQREIAALIADGCTNAQIAERLVLTPGTVANHPEHILTRLGFSNRSQVAVWATQHGLHPAGADGRASSTGGIRSAKMPA